MIEQKFIIPKSNFSLAFEQMCGFVAIANTRTIDETLRQLILQCFVILPNERFEHAGQLKDAIEVLFGLGIPEYQVERTLQQLIAENLVQQNPTYAHFVLPPRLQKDLQKHIDEAKALEERVKQEWLKEMLLTFSNLSSDQLWDALRVYLSSAFRRHGIQTVALLDPTVNIAPSHFESLSSLLDNALKEVFSPEQYNTARAAISSFLSTVGEHADRATYIAQLADGAFSYYSLTVSPDVAEQFRKRLNSLTIFLDTNFLFGILDLHVNPLVQISHELLDAVEQDKLPFKLRFHEETEQEMRTTIDHYWDILRTQHWSQKMSQIACSSRYTTGILLKYHQLNAEQGIDVNTFFKRYAHLDVLLKEKNISIYKDRLKAERSQERINLQYAYQEFLQTLGKEKPYETIRHDTILLDTVDVLRSRIQSSLEMGALFITCDYSLYRFDWQRSRSARNRVPCVVLPNVFWQVLRPFVSSDANFDRSFAETFAIPEFRTISTGASKAYTKLLSLLAMYDNLPEETAARMVSNDLMIEKLSDVKDEKQFKEYVDAALVAENEFLFEERAVLAKQLESEKAEKLAKEKQFEQVQMQNQREKAERERERQQSEKELGKKITEEKKQARLIFEQAERERQAREAAEKQAEEEGARRKSAERMKTIYAMIQALILSCGTVVLFEFLIYLFHWNWLIENSSSYGLQAAIDLMLTFAIFSIFSPKLRNWFLGGGLFALVVALLQILGGPIKPDKGP